MLFAIRRTVKKATYATLFGLVIAVFVIVIIAPPNQPRQTTTSSAQPVSIDVESIDSVTHANSVDIVARIRNPNPRAGVPEFIVTFILLDDAEREIERLQETTYLLPGSLNYIAALDVPLSATLSQVRVEVEKQPIFTTVPKSISTPTFNSFLRGRSTRQVGTKKIEIQKGIVTNTGTLSFRRVDITGVAFDSANNVVGIGKTFIGQFAVGEQREFTIEWPAPATATQRVIILPSANIFNEDNILQPQGDPSLLR